MPSIHRPVPVVKSSQTPKSSASVQFTLISRPMLADPRLNPSDKLVLLALQLWGWDDDRCFPSNETIREATALSVRTVRSSLKHLVELGFIRIEEEKSNRTGRAIVRLWMDNPELHPHRINPPLGGKNCRSPWGQILPPSLGGKNDTPSNLVVVTEELTGRGPGIRSLERQRPEAAPTGPMAPALDRVVAEKVPVVKEVLMLKAEVEDDPRPAPAEDPRALGPSVRAAVEQLVADHPVTETQAPVEQGQEWKDDLAERARATDDPILQAEARRLARSDYKPPAAIPPGVTTEDLLASLETSDDGSIVGRATRALMVELGDREQSWPYIHQLCERIWQGRGRVLPAACLIEPYRGTMRAVAGPRPPEKPAAYFTRSVENWLREHAG